MSHNGSRIDARRRWDPFLTFPVTAALVMGSIGFARGFIGPFGVGSTGHVGFVIGCAMGVTASILRFRTVTFLLALIISSVVWTVVLFYWRQHW